jgi:hypothetical protein
MPGAVMVMAACGDTPPQSATARASGGSSTLT